MRGGSSDWGICVPSRKFSKILEFRGVSMSAYTRTEVTRSLSDLGRTELPDFVYRRRAFIIHLLEPLALGYP